MRMLTAHLRQLMMLYPIPPPPSFAFYVVEVMSSPRYHLKRMSRIGVGPLHCMLNIGIYRRTRLHRSSHGILIRDRGGCFDGERHSKGKWVLWPYESGPI
jgi:AP-3 complex subunit delta-1